LRFCCGNQTISPHVTDLIGGVAIEEADEPDFAWLDPMP
jgi:hypothetical protein